MARGHTASGRQADAATRAPGVASAEPLASLVAQMIKHLPAMSETRVRSLGWEDPLENGLATRSSILAWEIPLTEEPGGLQSMGLQRVGHNWATDTAGPALTLHRLPCHGAQSGRAGVQPPEPGGGRRNGTEDSLVHAM